MERLAQYIESHWGPLEKEIARQSRNEVTIQMLKGYIDIALDNRDEAMFMELTNKLKAYEV